MPNGTINNVTRVHRTGLRIDSVDYGTAISVTTTEIEQYNWFAGGQSGVLVSITYIEGQVVTSIDGMDDIITEINRTQSVVYNNPEASGSVAVNDLRSLGMEVVLKSANPTPGGVILNFESENSRNVNIKLVNMVGRVLQTFDIEIGSGNSKLLLNLSHLPSGIYLVNIQSGNAQKTLKIMKE